MRSEVCFVELYRHVAQGGVAIHGTHPKRQANRSGVAMLEGRTIFQESFKLILLFEREAIHNHQPSDSLLFFKFHGTRFPRALQTFLNRDRAFDQSLAFLTNLENPSFPIFYRSTSIANSIHSLGLPHALELLKIPKSFIPITVPRLFSCAASRLPKLRTFNAPTHLGIHALGPRVSEQQAATPWPSSARHGGALALFYTTLRSCHNIFSPRIWPALPPISYLQYFGTAASNDPRREPNLLGMAHKEIAGGAASGDHGL
jgi:hypothetical protein